MEEKGTHSEAIAISATGPEASVLEHMVQGPSYS